MVIGGGWKALRQSCFRLVPGTVVQPSAPHTLCIGLLSDPPVLVGIQWCKGCLPIVMGAA